jgi:MFS family permease
MPTDKEKSTLFDTFESSFTQTGSTLAYFLVPILTTLFFIEAFRAFVPGIYAALFHVVFQDPGWIGSLMTILALLFIFVPLFTNKLCKHFGQNRIYLLSIVVIAVARVLIACHLGSLIDTILAGLIIAFYGIFASIFLKRLVKNDLGMELKAKVSIFTVAFIATFLLDMLIRSIGLSADITLLTPHINPEIWYTIQYIWLAVQVPLSIILIGVTLKTKSHVFPDDLSEEVDEQRNEPWVLNAAGLGMFLFLLFHVFLYANGIAEYTDTSYLILNPMLIAAVTPRGPTRLPSSHLSLLGSCFLTRISLSPMPRRSGRREIS